MKPLLLLTALACFACRTDPPGVELPPPAVPAAEEQTPSAATEGQDGRGAAYDWHHPAATFRLPAVLEEISGLTVLADGRLAAVQDEAGVVFVLDPASGAIVEQQPFAGEGDFEGIEATPEALWALRSDGTLFEIRDGRATEHATTLGRRCDAEGLGYDARGGRLLVACKEKPGGGLKDARTIHAFDLGQRRYAEAPAFTLDRDALDADDPFKPSAVAVHPRTGEVYVLSSRRKAVAVLDAGGALQRVHDLDAGQHAQPEGLAFAPDGTLYLSNEGDGGAATLHVFKPAP